MKENMNENYVKIFKSDIYIMIAFKSMGHVNISQNIECDEIAREYLNCIKEKSAYENNNVTKDLKRTFIGKNYIACLNYNYDGNVIAKEPVYMFLTEHKLTGLYLLTIMNLKNKFSPTQIQDQVTTDNIFIYDESNKMININDFMKNKFKLERCGEAKTLLSLSNKPKDSLEFNCMLASETYKSFADDGHYYRLTSEEIEKASKDNFSQYDFYEIYAYKSAVIYILKTFGDNDILNIQDEIPILFIMELIMLQSASVLRTNNEIIEQLSKGGTVSLRFIENLYKEFGKTIRFWNKDVFKYVTVQNISSKINEAFDTKNITEEYYKNQDFLEHIVNLRDIQDSNKESKILNIIVLILTIVQVIPIIIEFINWFFSLNIKNFGFIYWVDLSILLLILVILLLKKRIEKKKNFYREGS